MEIADKAFALEIQHNLGTAVPRRFGALIVQRNFGLVKQTSFETASQNVTVTQRIALDLSRQLA